MIIKFQYYQLNVLIKDLLFVQKKENLLYGFKMLIRIQISFKNLHFKDAGL